MADLQEFQAEEGTSQQLARGEATQLNEALPAEGGTPPEQGAPAAQPVEPQFPELAQPSDYEPLHTPENDDEEFLTGPTLRPGEPVTTGAFSGAARGLPPDIVAALPAYQEAASVPGASPQIQLLAAALADMANR